MFVRIAAAVAVVVFLCQLPATAQSYTSRTDLYLIIEASVVPDDPSLTILQGAPVMQTVARAPRAVKLKEDVTLGNIGTGVNFKAGDVLFGRYDKSVWSYCGVAGLNTESRAANVAVMGVLTAGVSLLLEPLNKNQFTNCLYDADQDGVFDSGWGAGDAESENSMVAFDMTKKALSVNPAYERVAPSEGPAMPVVIKWRKNGNAGTITFYTEFAGGTADKATFSIPANGSDPVEVKLAGATFLLETYNATDKSIRVQIKEGFPSRYVRIPAIRTTTYSYY